MMFRNVPVHVHYVAATAASKLVSGKLINIDILLFNGFNRATRFKTSISGLSNSPLRIGF